MGNRTVWLYGSAYSSTGTVSVQVNTVNAGLVFDGPVNTIASDLPTKTTEYAQLISWIADDETPISTTSFGVVTLAPTGGDIVLVTTGINKWDVYDYSQVEQFSAFVVKANATVDGEPYDPGESAPGDGPEEGAWHYIIRDGESMTVDLHLHRLQYGVPGFIYPPELTVDGNTPRDYDPDTYNDPADAPVYDPAKEGLMTPSFVPEYGNGANRVPTNIPAPVEPPPEGTRHIFSNNNDPAGKIVVGIDLDNDNEMDIVYTKDQTGVSVQVDEDVSVSVTISETGSVSSAHLDIDNDAEPDIIITKNADGTYNVEVDEDLDVQIDVDITGQ